MSPSNRVQKMLSMCKNSIADFTQALGILLHNKSLKTAKCRQSGGILSSTRSLKAKSPLVTDASDVHCHRGLVLYMWSF